MLFGLCNISIIYQTLINQILDNCLDIYIIIYLNNILVYSKTILKHKMYIKKILIKVFNK